MKNIIKNKIAALLLTVSFGALVAFEAHATLTTLPIGGNDNASIQLFPVTNTLPPAVNGLLVNGVTNTMMFVDISQFNELTLFFTTTNGSLGNSTNVFTIARSLDGSVLGTETTPYRTFTVVTLAGTYTQFQTNLISADIAGQGYLALTSLTNASATALAGTNGAGGAGYAWTNAACGMQIGVMYKIKHALR